MILRVNRLSKTLVASIIFYFDKDGVTCFHKQGSHMCAKLVVIDSEMMTVQIDLFRPNRSSHLSICPWIKNTVSHWTDTFGCTKCDWNFVSHFSTIASVGDYWYPAKCSSNRIICTISRRNTRWNVTITTARCHGFHLFLYFLVDNHGHYFLRHIFNFIEDKILICARPF